MPRFYSTLQAKVAPYFILCKDVFLAVANAFQHLCGEVIILNVVYASFDHLSNMKRFGAPSYRRYGGESMLGFG